MSDPKESPPGLYVARFTPREAGRATVPAEAWEPAHPDHDHWVEGSGRCHADDCPRHGAVEPSDLPVGQQSKGLPGPLIEVLDAYEARIRAQVAEDIAREIEQVVGGFPLNGLRRPKLERGLHVSDAVWAARIARKHGAKDSDSSPAALTDVVGTPEPDCPNCRRYGAPARVEHCGPGCHEAHTYLPPCELSPAGLPEE